MAALVMEVLLFQNDSPFLDHCILRPSDEQSMCTRRCMHRSLSMVITARREVLQQGWVSWRSSREDQRKGFQRRCPVMRLRGGEHCPPQQLRCSLGGGARLRGPPLQTCTSPSPDSRDRWSRVFRSHETATARCLLYLP